MYDFKIKVPIRAHLKKMIAKNRDIEPFEITMRKDHYASIFYTSFQRSSFPQNSFKEVVEFNDEIELFFPEHVAKENRFIIDRKRISFIDGQLRSLFDDRLFEYLDQNCREKGDVQHFCLKFLDSYGITEDEITLGALKKSFYRYRKKNGLTDKSNFRAKASYHKPDKKKIKTFESKNDLFSEIEK